MISVSDCIVLIKTRGDKLWALPIKLLLLYAVGLWKVSACVNCREAPACELLDMLVCLYHQQTYQMCLYHTLEVKLAPHIKLHITAILVNCWVCWCASIIGKLIRCASIIRPIRCASIYHTQLPRKTLLLATAFIRHCCLDSRCSGWWCEHL